MSYQSQKENFNSVSEEGIKLKKVFEQNGVLGCKMIGDGWGGYFAGLIQRIKAQKTIERIIDDYFLDQNKKIFINDDLNNLIFSCHPSNGALVLDPKNEIWF